MQRNPSEVQPMESETDAEKKLWLDFAVPRVSLYHGAAAVASLKAMAYSGLSHSVAELKRDVEKFNSLTEPPEELRKYIEMRRLLHIVQRDSAKAAVDAAALLYAHAILDAVVFKLCSISVALDADAWAEEIEGKQVRLSELRVNAVEQVKGKMLKAYLSQIERESLLRKCDTLFRVIKPATTRGILKKYKYSRERLALLDGLRHDLVHKLMFHRKLRQPDAKADYLLNTGHFLVNLLSRHYRASAIRMKRETAEG
jgi:hypothetical protein